MSRPLHRGGSGGGRIGVGSSYYDSIKQQGSQIKKEKPDKEDMERGGRAAASRSVMPLHFLFTLFFPDKSGENGFGYDPFVGVARSTQNLTLLLIKLSLVVILVLALTGLLWWTISISTSSRGYIFRGYRKLQEQLITDLADIGELSQGMAAAKLKEVEFYTSDLDNYVPCFNVSNEIGRQCGGQGFRDGCLVLPPQNYRIPLRWPTGRDVIWLANVKINAQQVLSSGNLTKRMMMLDEDQISFHSDSAMFDGVEDYSHQIVEMIRLRNESYLIQAGVRTVLDIGCGYGSFGAHLFSKQLLTVCIAEYEDSGSQVQLTLERGLPAMIGSFTSKKLPYPSLSFDMLHCARCGVDWDQKDGILLVEVDRVLRPGGYFVWTSPLTTA